MIKSLYGIRELIQKEDAAWTIEVGGGLGFLTELIAERRNLTVFEIDEKLNSRHSIKNSNLKDLNIEIRNSNIDLISIN